MLHAPVQNGIESVNLWQQLDQAEAADTGFSLLLYVVKEKWEKKLKQKFARKEEAVKTHLLISGGNYTCDILLPYLLKRVKDRFPLFPIRIGLAEFAKYEDLSEIGDDIILSGFYPHRDNFKNFKRNINSQNFDTTRSSFCHDVTYLGCSREVFEADTKENILQKFPLVRGRYFRDSSMQVEIPFKNRVTPKGREDEKPIIVSDKHYYSYLLMRYSVGLWVTFASSPYDEKLRFLEEIEGSKTMRYVIYSKEYEKIGKVITKQAQVFMRKDLQHDKNSAAKGRGSQRFRI